MMVVFGITEAVILKQEIEQDPVCKIQAMGTSAAHWVMWDHPSENVKRVVLLVYKVCCATNDS